MTIVSNTSPISNLAKVGQINLMQQLYGTILIPTAVYEELLDMRAGETVIAAVQSATDLGLKIIGVLGILLAAKHQNLIMAIKPIMDDLMTQANFRISSQLYADVLEAADE